MTSAIRVIPKLDIKGPNLVKGIHLEGLRVLGKPEDFARRYYEQGADELLYIDVVASLYNRNSLHDIIARTAKEIFIPLTVAGGLRTIDDIRGVLRAGADKVALNTAVIKHPDLIRDASRIFGSSTITISIEAHRQPDGRYLAFTDNGREFTGVDAIGWAKRVEELGAGEILLTSIDREGTGQGYDLELTKTIATTVSIPVIACGGAGKLPDLASVIRDGCANAVALASILHYDYLLKHRTDADFREEGNIEFLKHGKADRSFQTCDLHQVKEFLSGQGIPCRHALTTAIA